MHPANLQSIDYQAESGRFRKLSSGIVDIHTHILGKKASAIYARAASDYGIELTYSMTPLREVSDVRSVLGDRIRFIAIPDWADPDPERAFGIGYCKTIEEFYSLGSRIAKFWSPPRGVDIGISCGIPDLLKIDAPHRIEAMQVAYDLGMVFMAHIGDPDTWFATRYSDASIYGTKSDQYKGFKKVLEKFDRPWIAAHMGGWPEDLKFLSTMLDRYPHLYLDCSATKWIVRELSKYEPDELQEFFSRFDGRIFFGSDIVSNDSHLNPLDTTNAAAAKAGNEHEAYDLYASRYWALRTLFETNYQGLSPIADPDLAMVKPDQFTEIDSPPLRGMSFPDSLVNSIYYGTYLSFSKIFNI